MNRRAWAASILLLLAVSPGLFAQSAEALQRELNAHAATISAWATDKTIVEAVRAQNARKMTLAEIQKEDASWMAGKNEALVTKMITGVCADHLRDLAKKAGYGESFVMDNQGALVCATEKTSDYWQGDEPKWIRSFNGGNGTTFIDRPRFDNSAHTYLAQISVPIIDGGKTIGVITAGAMPKMPAQH